MAQRMAVEEDVFKLVEDELGGRVVVAIYLVADHLHLLVDLRLRIGGMEHNVGEQCHGAREVLLEDGGVVARVLLVGICVKTSAHLLQAVEDAPGAAPLRSLEGNVLAEVGQSLFARQLVAGASVYLIAAIHHLAIRWQVDDAESVV